MKNAKEILDNCLRNRNQKLLVEEPSKIGLRSGYPVALEAMELYAKEMVKEDLKIVDRHGIGEKYSYTEWNDSTVTIYQNGEPIDAITAFWICTLLNNLKKERLSTTEKDNSDVFGTNDKPNQST